MRKNKMIALALVASLTGCASAKVTATRIVAASDIAADELADTWSAASDSRIAECRTKDLPTPEERAECLGPFKPAETQKVVAAIQALVVVQLAVKSAAECEELKACVEKTDWRTLATEAAEAWAALKPYILAAREQSK